MWIILLDAKSGLTLVYFKYWLTMWFPIFSQAFYQPSSEVGRILLVRSVFSRRQLNSETSRLCKRSFPFPKGYVCSLANLSLRKHITAKSAKLSSS